MNIFVIGDSISIYYGPFLEANLKELGIGYDRKSGVDAARKDMNVAQGANGGDSAMVLAYLRQRVARGSAITADTLLINCGLHDIKTDPATGRRQVPIEAYRDNLEAIVMLATNALARRMVWIRTTPCDERIHNARCSTFHRFAADCDAFNQAADAVMAARGVPVIDLHAFTRSLGQELFCDHVHFTEPVRRLQAAYIAGWLQCFRDSGAGVS